MKIQPKRTFTLFCKESHEFTQKTTLLILFVFISSLFPFGGGCAGGTRGTGGANSIDVGGTLRVSGTQEPISDVTITIAGQSTTTDQDGTFLLTELDNSGEFTIKVNGNNIERDVLLSNITASTLSVFIELEFDGNDGGLDIVDVVVVDPGSTSPQSSLAPTPAASQAPSQTGVNPLPSVNISLVPSITPLPASSSVAPSASPSPKSVTPPGDNLPPNILTIEVTSISDTAASIIITGDKKASIQGIVDGTNKVDSRAEFLTEHTLNFTGLSPETSYSFTVVLTDEKGKNSQSQSISATTNRQQRVEFDYSGMGGVDPLTTYFAGAWDMGNGASGVRFPTPSTLDLYSRNFAYTSPGGQVTVVMYTQFSSATSIFPDSVILGSPTSGFIEIWYEDGSGSSASNSTPQSYSDGIRVASGTFISGSGTYSTTAEFGSASLQFRIDSANSNYFFNKAPTSGAISFLIGRRGTGAVSQFPIAPGGTPVSVSGLAITAFPDGGINLK